MPDNDPLKSLGILLAEVSRLIRRDFEQRIQPLGLTQGQWRTLVYLSRYEGLNQASLADILEIRPITLARLIDRLEEAGWVERRRDPQDRRAFQLYLTDKAQPVLADIENLAIGTRKTATQGISKAEQKQVIDILSKIKSNLLPTE